MKKYWLFLLTSFSGYAQSFDTEVGLYVQKLRLPVAAVGVAKGDSLIYFRGFGYGNEQTREAIGPDHIFGIASVSKSISAVALQRSVEEGKLSWNDRIGSFPNRFFTPGRWTGQTTLAHIVSHTSESDPIESKFLYNGSKYNIALNAFDVLNEADHKTDITRRFTTEIEQRILMPFNMDHTLLRYDAVQTEKLKLLIVSPWHFVDSTGVYTPEIVNMTNMQSGPGFGMMSSLRDLLKYASGLNRAYKDSFRKVSTPFYPGSPYGLGWFTTSFEGHQLSWVYGYGNTDSALLLKVPEKDLTFIFLCGTSVSSASMRLGFGNPLNSPLVVAFLKNYVFNIKPEDHLDYEGTDAGILSKLGRLEKKYKSQIFREELYAKASLGILLPRSLEPEKTHAERLLALYLNHPSRYFDIRIPTAFDLIENSGNPELRKLGENLINQYRQSGEIHPFIALCSGRILEKLGKKAEAIALYKTIADSDYFKESADKMNAMMLLARHYSLTHPDISKKYLERFISYKDLISARDQSYAEAKEMLKKLSGD